jgi:sulfoxide reductase heme-binding subunit YedZ
VTSQLWWYVARSAGIVSWALVAVSVCWGLLLAGRPISGRTVAWARPHRVLDLHRFLGGLAVVFTGVHVGAVVADSYVHFGLADVLVPFASSWHPGAVAWGVVGLWLLAAIELTSLARRSLPARVWHGVHLASYPLFVVATAHGLTAGSDAASPVLRLSMVAAVAAIVGLTVYRVGELSTTGRPSGHRAPPGHRAPSDHRAPSGDPAEELETSTA